MNKKRLFIGVGISLAVVMMFSLWGLETVFAMKCQLIRIESSTSGTEKPVMVDPETLVVSPGDCVFWANITNALVKIRFYGSEECAAGTVGFVCDKENKYFTTDYYKTGGTASITLKQKGTYKYELSTKLEPTVRVTGVIKVQ